MTLDPSLWNDEDFIAFDFETSGELPEYALQPWRVAQGKAWATSFVWSYIIDGELVTKGGLFPKGPQLRQMLEFAIETKRTIIGWNVVFDIQWLLAYGLEDLVMRVRWLDGMLLWRHATIEPEYDTARHKKKSYSLKECVRQLLPTCAGYELDIDFHTTDRRELERLHDYNVKDVNFTLHLARHWYEYLEPKQLRAAKIEASCLPLIARANLHGMLVDTLVTNELAAYLTDTAAKKLAELAPHGVSEKVVRSPTQLAKLLFDEWGLTPLKENVGKKTGKVSRATDKEVLHELSLSDPRAKTLREYREALNNRTKFAEAPLVSATYNGDGHTRPQAIVFGTYSGRLTYASKQGRNKEERPIGFALHQEKRGEMFRSILVPPPGYTLMEFDASGQEFRWMAIASGDPVMLQLCKEGEDPHSYMGARIAGVDYKELITAVKAEEKQGKAQRQLGKVANLSLQYRTSAPKLRTVARVQYGLPMTEEQATHIHQTYVQTYKQVPTYWKAQIQRTRMFGYVETFAGRRVQVNGNWEGKEGWAMGSTSINYRIQGTGADQKYLALSVLKPYLNSNRIYFAWDLHDGIYLYVPDPIVAQAAHDIRRILNTLPYQQAWGFTPPIPLPWDCKVGKAWGALKDWHDG